MQMQMRRYVPPPVNVNRLPLLTHVPPHVQASHSSKRSRASSAASKAPHACPACDASFSTRARLRLHGRAAGAKEACRIAVAYDFE